MNSPLVSIGMPVYNAGKFLNAAVNSIILQSFKNWELILIDDGSSDGAVEHIKKLNDPRITIVQDGNNKGLVARLNQAIDMANGKYFARMDGDDIALPTRLEEQINFLENHPDIDLLSTRVETINVIGEKVGSLPFDLTHADLCSKPWRSIYMPHPTWMGKTSWFKIFKYRVPAAYYSEDQELLLRSYSKSRFACLDNVLLHYRIKDKINAQRLLLTYWAILKFQFTYFYKHKKTFLVPAFFVFAMRVFKVVVIIAKQSLR